MGYGFKMEIPFDTIVNTEFINDSPGTGRAAFYLSQPPIFYLEYDTPNGTRAWKRCADWTEGMQATKVLRHDLTGSAVQLAHILRTFNSHNTSDIRLHKPAYLDRPQSRPATAIDLSPMPLSSGMAAADRSYASHPQSQYPADMIDQTQQMSMMGIQKRQFSSAPSLQFTPPSNEVSEYDDRASSSHSHAHSHSVSPTPYAVSYSQLAQPMPSRSMSASGYSTPTPMYEQYPSAEQARHSPMGSDYGHMPLQQRAYGSVDSVQYMSDNTDSTSSYMSDRPNTSHSQYTNSSPSIMSTPFYSRPMNGSLQQSAEQYMPTHPSMLQYPGQDDHSR